MKLSAKLLIGIFLFFLISLFASNKLLKEQFDKNYDRNQTKAKSQEYWNYTKLTDKPFKHVKIENGSTIGGIELEQGDIFAVYLNEKPNYITNKKITGKITSEIINDTLIVHIPADATNSWNSNDNIIHIFGTHFESITCKDSRLKIKNLNQKEVNVNLLGHSTFTVLSDTTHTDVLNVTLAEYSRFYWSSANTFQKVNAHLSKGSELDLRGADVKSLNFNASENSDIKLSSKTLKALMGK